MIYKFDGQRNQAGHKIRKIGAISALVLFGHTASAAANDEISSGFYAATQSARFAGTGQLFQCRGGQCTFQEYEGTVANAEPVQTDVTVNRHPIQGVIVSDSLASLTDSVPIETIAEVVEIRIHG